MSIIQHFLFDLFQNTPSPFQIIYDFIPGKPLYKCKFIKHSWSTQNDLCIFPHNLSLIKAFYTSRDIFRNGFCCAWYPLLLTIVNDLFISPTSNQTIHQPLFNYQDQEYAQKWMILSISQGELDCVKLLHERLYISFQTIQRIPFLKAITCAMKLKAYHVIDYITHRSSDYPTFGRIFAFNEFRQDLAKVLHIQKNLEIAIHRFSLEIDDSELLIQIILHGASMDTIKFIKRIFPHLIITKTAVWYAIQSGNVHLVELFVEKFHFTITHDLIGLACFCGKTTIFQWFIIHHIWPTDQTTDYEVIMILKDAIQSGNLLLVQHVIDATNVIYVSTLHVDIAACCGFLDIVRYFYLSLEIYCTDPFDQRGEDEDDENLRRKSGLDTKFPHIIDFLNEFHGKHYVEIRRRRNESVIDNNNDVVVDR